MTRRNMVEALNDALHLGMREHDDAVLLGEDVGRLGGVFRVTAGLQEAFGSDRVLDTPLSETGIIASAIGMALYGLRPIAEIQFADFMFPAFDQIVNELAKYRYRSGNQFETPVLVRMPVGGGVGGGHYHSQSPEAYFAHTAGLKVVLPSSPYDAKGLLLSALRDRDPVIFLEPKKLYRTTRGEVPDGAYAVPIGSAHTLRQGKDITLIAYGATVPLAVTAAEQAADENIEADVIDLRTLVPLDIDTVLASVQKTSRVVLVHEAPRTCGFAAELAALIAEKAFWSLDAPILRVTGFDTPFPYRLENDYMPTAQRILEGVRATMNS